MLQMIWCIRLLAVRLPSLPVCLPAHDMMMRCVVGDWRPDREEELSAHLFREPHHGRPAASRRTAAQGEPTRSPTHPRPAHHLVCQVRYAMTADNQDGYAVEWKTNSTTSKPAGWERCFLVGVVRSLNIPVFKRSGYKRPAPHLREAAKNATHALGLKVGVDPRYGNHWLFEGIPPVFWAPPGRGKKYSVTVSADVEPPLVSMASGPFQPAVMELPQNEGRVVVTSFHVMRAFESTILMMKNFLHHHHAISVLVKQDRTAMYTWFLSQGIYGMLSLEYDGSERGSGGGTKMTQQGGVMAEASGSSRVRVKEGVPRYIQKYEQAQLKRRGPLTLTHRTIHSDSVAMSEASKEGQDTVPFLPALTMSVRSDKGVGPASTARAIRARRKRRDQSAQQALKPVFFSTHKKWKMWNQLDADPSTRCVSHSSLP